MAGVKKAFQVNRAYEDDSRKAADKLTSKGGEKFKGKDAVQKRNAEHSPDAVSKKRFILGEITNANNNKAIQGQKGPAARGRGKKTVKVANTTSTTTRKQQKQNDKKSSPPSSNEDLDLDALEETLKSSQEEFLQRETTLYMTAIESSPSPKKKETLEKEWLNYEPPDLPNGVQDFDFENIEDPNAESNYALDVFNYYKEKEIQFKIDKYLDRQAEISAGMRAILVDWMVEVQESFELNHETLYLAVKLVDLYLMKHPVSKSCLQLLGATAVLIACKYDERCPPAIEDFLYICDDAYSRKELVQMEISLLKAVDFYLGMPLSYRFLRRYARCAKLSLETLTLARYILEMSLLDYTLIDRRDSEMAAASLLLALKIRDMEWSLTLEFYSGYAENELDSLKKHLNGIISSPPQKSLETIRTKYSHKVFFEVALIPPLKL